MTEIGIEYDERVEATTVCDKNPRFFEVDTVEYQLFELAQGYEADEPELEVTSETP